ncbi:MAG: hypothetical protein WED10_10575 [Brumimicrobium sp.]
MTRILIIFILIVQQMSCHGQVDISFSEQKDSSGRDSIAVNEDSVETNQVISLDSLWNKLVFYDGGCLTGGQRVRNGRFGNEGCVMSGYGRNRKEWNEFFSYPKTELTPFLISKFSDTTSTKIHTCPCMAARNGEVAVYALQNIYKKNWYDLNGFTKYASKESSSCMDIEQSWLWDILENEEQRENLTKQWLKQLEEE